MMKSVPWIESNLCIASFFNPLMVTAPVPDSLTQGVGSSVFEAVSDRKQPHRYDMIIIDDQPRNALNDCRTLLI